MPPTRKVLQVWNPAMAALILELNGAASTDIKAIHFCLGEPQIQENIRTTWDTDGEFVTKRRERPRMGHFILRIPDQTTMPNLRAKVEAVRDAFLITDNKLKVQYAGDAVKFYKIYSTHLVTPRQQLEEARNSEYYKAIDQWEYEVKLEHKAVSDTNYAIF